MSNITCPHCQSLLEADIEDAGKSVKCEHCDKGFVLPDDASAYSNEMPLPALLAILCGGHITGLRTAAGNIPTAGTGQSASTNSRQARLAIGSIRPR